MNIVVDIVKVPVLVVFLSALALLAIILFEKTTKLIFGNLFDKSKLTALIVDFAPDNTAIMPTFSCLKCKGTVGFADIVDETRRRRRLTDYQNGRNIRLYCRGCHGTILVCNGEVTGYEPPERSAILDGGEG